MFLLWYGLHLGLLIVLLTYLDNKAGSTLMAEQSKALPLTTQCFSPLNGFESPRPRLGSDR